MAELRLFTGNSNRLLAAGVAGQLRIQLGESTVARFSDGEVNVEIHENVRGRDVFILQSTCAPTNDNLMELIVMADCLRRASAHRITAVIPYFGYARQDRRVRSARVPITAKVVALMLECAGIDRVLTVDLHSDQIQGFFNLPVDNIYATPVLLRDIRYQNYENLMIVSPDVGGVVRARALAKQLDDAELAIIDKRRARANESQVMHVIGDVKNRTCLLVDDIIDTAGTLCKAADALKEQGSVKVIGYCTHAVLSGDALKNIGQSSIDEVVVTDTVPLSKEAQTTEKVRQLGISQELAESIRRVSNEESLSAMFMSQYQPDLF